MEKAIDLMLKVPHPAQEKILLNRKRFNVLKCGRRFGKTEIFQELASESIEDGHIFAYFSPTYKDLFEVWQETKRIFYEAIQHSNESVKQITFFGGAKVDFWSVEDPDSGRGRKYHRVIVDECEKAGKFKQAWEESIRATLTDFKGDAYLISTPKFGDTYFKQICKHEDKFPDWKTFIFTSFDNPYIDSSEIEDARSLLGQQVFECEYLAMDLDGRAINPFFFQYNKDYHICDVQPPTNKQLFISIDFNLNPFAVIFANIWKDRIIHCHIINEVEIKQGSIPAMIDLIGTMYGNQLHGCLLTGDAMGKRGEIGQRDNASNYTQLRRGLRLRETQLILPSNPTHENSRSDCNYVLYHSARDTPAIDFKIYKNCVNTIRDFGTVQCDAFGSLIKKDRKDLSQRADYADCGRYLINTFLKSWVLQHQKKR